MNIAVALAGMQHDTGQRLKVGLLDADVYGPSIPPLMSIHGRPDTGKGGLHSFIASVTASLLTVCCQI